MLGVIRHSRKANEPTGDSETERPWQGAGAGEAVPQARLTTACGDATVTASLESQALSQRPHGSTVSLPDTCWRELKPFFTQNLYRNIYSISVHNCPKREIVQKSLVGWMGKTDWCAPDRTLTQFSPVTRSCPTLCHPVDCSTPGVLSMRAATWRNPQPCRRLSLWTCCRVWMWRMKFLLRFWT